MTEHLQRTYAARADRADLDLDVADVLDLVPVRAAQRRHRRRTRLAAGATSVAVLAAVVTGSVVLSDHSTSDQRHHNSQQAAAAIPAGLATVAPAPAGAETSLGLVPTGWQYEGFEGATTTYIAPGATPSSLSDYVGKIAVMVGQRYEPASTYTLTVSGRPARISQDADGSSIGVLVPDRDGVQLEVDVQLPPALTLSHEQLLALAGSLDIRSTEHFAVG